MTFLKVSGITKQVEADFALREITFSQRRQQKIAIVGETGSGKSTLLKIIAGLVQQDGGDVFFQGEKVRGPSDSLVPGHGRIGYVSQDFELPKFLTVGQVLAYSNNLPQHEAEALYRVCRVDQLVTRKTRALSGGERQRIAIARVLATAPELVLLDEPFSNLDRVHKGILKSLIDDMTDILNISCILISHEPGDILPWADRVIILRKGFIVQQGSPHKIYRYPKDHYVAGLFGSYTERSAAVGFPAGPVPKGQRPRKFFRPEDFRLVASGKKGMPGKVVDIKYFGSHDEVVVDCGWVDVTVQSVGHGRKRGDRVYVALHQEAVF